MRDKEAVQDKINETKLLIGHLEDKAKELSYEPGYPPERSRTEARIEHLQAELDNLENELARL